MFTAALVEPVLLEAVMVWLAEARAAVGVPEITPETLFNVRPGGNAGETV
jgi:hypothetical protein